LSSASGQRIAPRDTLIIFDDVQDCFNPLLFMADQANRLMVSALDVRGKQ
jgi:hypothetical protein